MLLCFEHWPIISNGVYFVFSDCLPDGCRPLIFYGSTEMLRPNFDSSPKLFNLPAKAPPSPTQSIQASRKTCQNLTLRLQCWNAGNLQLINCFNPKSMCSSPSVHGHLSQHFSWSRYQNHIILQWQLFIYGQLDMRIRSNVDRGKSSLCLNLTGM